MKIDPKKLKRNKLRNHDQTDQSQTHGIEKTTKKAIQTNGAIIKIEEDIPLKSVMDSKAIFPPNSMRNDWHNSKKL